MTSQSQQNFDSNPHKDQQPTSMAIFVEPIKLKAFNFHPQDPSFSITNRSNRTKFRQQKSQREHKSRWKPIIGIKRLMDEPKLLMSLQKKKAKIISALRSKHVDSSFCGKAVGEMTGSKLRNYSSRLSSYKQIDETGEIFESTQKIQNCSTRKKKKIPYMNVSLKYFLKHGFKELGRGSQHENYREKGSNTAYYNLYATEQVIRNKKVVRNFKRAQTSMSTHRQRGNIDRKVDSRPRSVYYVNQ